LNYQQAMEGIDGQDYVSLVFVAKRELKSYKKRWLNQILVDLPFEGAVENWKDLYRQCIKVFGETLGVEYTFMLEDNIYCALKFTDGNWAPTSMLDYLTSLQEATQSGSSLIGSRVSNLGELNPDPPTSEWNSNIVQSCFLVKTKENEIYFTKEDGAGEAGFVQFYKNSNSSEVPVQQNQNFILLCGYSIDDPKVEGDRRQATYKNLEDLEPETYNHNLKIQVVSNEVVVDKVLSDESRYARALVLVGDSTAVVVLIAINDQIELLTPGNSYSLRNTKVVMYSGWMRIEVDEWGKIELLKEKIPINNKKNMSTIEYELVQSDEE